MKDLKVIFMGTPDFCVPILEELIKCCNVIAVVTQPDKEVGRKHEVIYCPIKKKALENNIKVLQPNKIREDYDDIIKLNPDIIITCAYGQIIPEIILNNPKYGCINVHASLLNHVNSKDRGLFKSKFYVINHTTAPAILVEIGFISSPIERAQVVSESRKQATAKAITEGIDDYFKK